MDGSLGSRTAALKEPYSDDPGNTGLPQFSQRDLDEMAVERARFGFQLGFHAIGDKAAAMALEAFQKAEQPPPTVTLPQLGPCRPAGQPYEAWDEKMPCPKNTASPKPLPHVCLLKDGSPCYPFLAGFPPRNRIEHAQVVDPADIPRFAKLGVIASMQPNHLLTDMNWAEDRLGTQARRLLLRLEGLPRRRCAAGLRHRLPCRTHHALPRPLRRRHPHERGRNQELFPGKQAHPRPGALRLHAGLGLRRVCREAQRQARCPATMRTSSWSTATSTKSPPRPFSTPWCWRPLSPAKRPTPAARAKAALQFVSRRNGTEGAGDFSPLNKQ